MCLADGDYHVATVPVSLERAHVASVASGPEEVSRYRNGARRYAVPRAHHVSKDGSAPLVHPSPLGQHKFSTMY